MGGHSNYADRNPSTSSRLMDEVDRRRSRHPLPVAHQGGGNRLYVDPERSSGGHDEYNGHPRGVSSTESRFETRPSYQAEPYRMPPRDPEVHRGPRVHGYQIHEASMYNAPSDPHINPSHESRPPYIGSPRGQIRPRINGNHNNNDRYGGGSSTAPYSTHSRRRDIGLSTRRARHDEHRQANGQHDWDDSYNDSSTNVSQERRGGSDDYSHASERIMFILPDEEPPRRRGPFHRRTREQLAQEQLDSFEARFSSRG